MIFFIGYSVFKSFFKSFISSFLYFITALGACPSIKLCGKPLLLLVDGVA